MSAPRVPPPAKPVVSLLSADLNSLWPEIKGELQSCFGPMDFISEPFAFTQTHYYDRELGTPILRRLLGFETLIPQDELPGMKLQTNALEDQWRRADGRRRVNVDPGLLCLERLVLATGKNFTHRIYLGQGIFADLTLVFQRGGWQVLPWTFPDYAGEQIQNLLTQIRNGYKQTLQKGRGVAEIRRDSGAQKHDRIWIRPDPG